MSRRRALALAAGGVAFAALGASKCATIASLALRKARLWDGTGAPPQNGMTVAMHAGVVIAVAPDADVQLGRDTEIVDCAGAFVMPGLIDAHVHVTEALLRGSPILGSWLRAGITTIRDTGTIWQGPSLLRSLAEQAGPGPRIIATGGLMTVPNGYPTSRGPTGIAGALQVATVEEAAAGAAQTLDAGAEFIKIAVETGRPGGHLLDDVGEPTLSVAQIEAIVEVAHARGAQVIAHVTNEWELRRALTGGVDGLAHTPLDHIPRDLLGQLVEREIAMTGTLNIWDGAGGPVTKAAQANVKRLHDAGGTVIMVTHFPFQVHDGVPLPELRMMFDAGLSREAVLLACTRDAAVACQLDGGTIEAGRVADVIVVQGDPSADLDALANVSLVVQGGRRVV